ncbi:TetR family transcriptional regulator [Actinoplanes sp. NPDC051411]|uniref:TetR/AcrR family transcriptional regulator n=1 Tax=Actinoplanes sp. NPDC051411 TaxID=3155522 RepID=UPI003425838E
MISTGELSPNQLRKREQIVEAARKVLATEGLAACSVRAVADASPLTKSAIHYYFADLNELVDAAMAGHIEAFLTRVRAAAARGSDPAERFWAAIEAYLGTFDENPAAALLWYDYWIDAARKGRLEPVDRMNREVVAMLTELLEAVPVPGAAVRAEAVFSALLGLVVQQSVRRRPPEEIRELIRLGAGLPGR